MVFVLAVLAHCRRQRVREKGQGVESGGTESDGPRILHVPVDAAAFIEERPDRRFQFPNRQIEVRKDEGDEVGGRCIIERSQVREGIKFSLFCKSVMDMVVDNGSLGKRKNVHNLSVF